MKKGQNFIEVAQGGSIPDLDKYRETYADGGTLIKNRTLMKDLAQLVS